MNRMIFAVFMVGISFSLSQINSGLSNEPIGDIVLYYISAEPISDVTVRPLCSYVDNSGNARDWLFDGIIVYNVHLHSYPDHPNHDTCENYINALFSGGHQLDSLDAIVGRVKQELNVPDFRWKVILTAPYAEDLPQGNIINYCNTMINLWNNANFSNLTLIGFYFGYREWVDQIVTTMGRNGVKSRGGMGSNLYILHYPFDKKWFFE